MLGTANDRRVMLGGQGRLFLSAQLFDCHSSSDDESKESEKFPTESDDSTKDGEFKGLLSTETSLARWKACEMLKVTNTSLEEQTKCVA